MIHPDTELRFINEIIGYGVVAKKFIPKGTVTWVQDELDQIFTPERQQQVSPLMREYLETYCFTNSEGNKVLCWDNAKFVNHSFMPTCMSTAYDFEIAIKDIQPGEQLTDDYGYLNIEVPFEVVDEGTERKVVYPDDLLRHYEEWDAAIMENIPLMLELQYQPLQKFIPKQTWEEFQKINSGAKAMKSLLTCYYDPAR
jgi:hypothetical protein